MSEADITAIKNLDNVQYCSPYEYTFGAVQAGRYEGYVFAIAGNQDIMPINQMTTKYGRAWTKTEYEQCKNVCLVSVLTAKQIFGK